MLGWKRHTNWAVHPTGESGDHVIYLLHPYGVRCLATKSRTSRLPLVARYSRHLTHYHVALQVLLMTSFALVGNWRFGSSMEAFRQLLCIEAQISLPCASGTCNIKEQPARCLISCYLERAIH